MPNMAHTVTRHNLKILNEDRQQPDQIPNGPGTCPVQEKCRSDCVVYRAAVTETMSGYTETYTGMTGREFKGRSREHKHNIKKKTAKQPTRPKTMQLI